MALSNLTDQELDRLISLKRQTDASIEENMPRERARTVAQGATLGFADEIEAFVRSGFSDRKYDDIRDELRQKLFMYKQQNPTEALSYELAGALVPTIGAALTGFGAATVPQTLGRVALSSGAQGLGMGLGYSEANTPEGMAADVLLGGTVGATLGPLTNVVLQGSGGVLKKIIDFTRENFGGKASNAVQMELQRIVEKTGKSVEEIVQDVADGRITSDNRTLYAVLKNMVNEGGESGQEILKRTKERAVETRGAAVSELQKELAPNVSPNVIRGYKMAEDEAKALESKAYNEVFTNNQEVSQDVAMSMLEAVQRTPSALAHLDNLYTASNLVPLFKRGENGAIEFVRMPTLKDAEIANRGIKTHIDKLYREGSNDLAVELTPISQQLTNSLDNFSPELAAVRYQASQRFATRRAFDLGRKAASANVDEMEMTIEKLANKPDELAALQAGFMDAIKVKLRKANTTLANLLDEDKQLGSMLRTILPNRDLRQLEQKLGVAADAQEIASKMPITAGSPTQALQKEESRIGSNIKLTDVARLGAKDPTVVLDLLGRMVKSKAPSLSEKERMKIVDVIFSKDPKLVRRSLVDETALTQLIRLTEVVLNTLAAGGTRGAAEQSIQVLPSSGGN